MKKIVVLISSLLLCVGLVACSDSSAENITVSGEFGKKPTVKINSTNPPKELISKVLIEGSGEKLTADSMATVDYYGIALDGKEPFDESFSKPSPFNLQVGRGVIEGWTKGLVGKKIGSRVLLVIPSDLAYGEAGSPPNIKPNASLVFVIDIYGGTVKKDRSVMSGAQFKVDNFDGVIVKGDLLDIPSVEFTSSAIKPTERKIVVLYEGNGDVLSEEDVIEVFPTVYEWGGKTADKTTSPKEGVPFTLPISKAADTDKLAGVKIGSRVLILEPETKDHAGKEVPAYAYVFDIVGKVGQRVK